VEIEPADVDPGTLWVGQLAVARDGDDGQLRRQLDLPSPVLRGAEMRHHSTYASGSGQRFRTAGQRVVAAGDSNDRAVTESVPNGPAVEHPEEFRGRRCATQLDDEFW
jgi:hypothetical protein